MKPELIQLTKRQAEQIEAGLEAYDQQHMGAKRSGEINIGIRINGKLAAGAIGCMTAFRILYVSTVFVEKAHRGKGLGRLLMWEVERQAVALGANTIRLDTFDWQGGQFYAKLGYEQVGYYENPQDGFAEYFFMKRI